jgi:hypothetical protein
MIAIKDVKAGEEVYTSYAALNVLRMPKAMRYQFLSGGSWFGPKVYERKRCLAEARGCTVHIGYERETKTILANSSRGLIRQEQGFMFRFSK